MAARHGGEERAVVQPGTSLAEAMKIAEQIRPAIEAMKVIKKSSGESFRQVAISIGVAQFVAVPSACATLGA